jgi:hypothetical protein
LEDFSNELAHGSRFKVSCVIRPEYNGTDFSEAQVFTTIHSSLGSLAIDFTPLPLPLPREIAFLHRVANYPENHGPLPIQDLQPLERMSQTFCIEASPFSASFETIPSIPTVASPFEVLYTITNKTNNHQRVRISMIESEDTVSGMLVSGMINGHLVLGPREAKHVSYSILISNVGEAVLPALNVFSLRYNAYIIKNCSRSIFVMP